jgi:hypothetical protein
MQPIDFAAYSGDCTIAGKVTMFGERLTDFLNGQERFRLHHVVCQSLEDGREVAIDSLSIEREDLLIVVATGPRGSEKQRVSLQTARLQVSIGPYLILGRLHTAPGADAMATVHLPAVIVNRMLVEWISPTSDAATFFPDVEVRSPFTARMLKDFTGSSGL